MSRVHMHCLVKTVGEGWKPIRHGLCGSFPAGVLGRRSDAVDFNTDPARVTCTRCRRARSWPGTLQNNVRALTNDA